jgi:diguanylate cyclase (GGDEF)-like protein
MLWNKRKATDPMRGVPAEPRPSSAQGQAASPPGARPPGSASRADTPAYRVPEADRALTAVGTLLTLYGRHAFDTEHTATTIRERCEEWAQRIVLGVLQRGDEAGAPSSSSQSLSGSRDWRGLERFFEQQRQLEGEFVQKSLGGLRDTVLSLARSLGGSIGEDREADALVEDRLSALSKAIGQGDVASITRAATSVIEASRKCMAQRRERESRHSQKLDKELRALRDSVADDGKGNDELTGLYGRGPYEQQLDQLTAIGMLLEQPPWLLVIDVGAGKRDPNKREAPKLDPKKRRAVPDRTLREVSHCISRTFLRRQDFAARTGQNELCVLLVDMTRDEMAAAVERLLETVFTRGRELPNNEVPVLNIGVVRLRANEDGERWRARADVGVERAREDGGDTYTIDGQKPR